MPSTGDLGHFDPMELREIHANAPQMFVDDYLVENRFDANMLSATVPHAAHSPERRPDPVLRPDRPWEHENGLGYPGVVFDGEKRRYRLYYSVYHKTTQGKPDYPPGGYFLCYAESEDGIHWEKPDLGLIPWGEQRETNIVLQGECEANLPHVHAAEAGEDGGPKNIGTVPARFLRGHRFVLYYNDMGHYLATSDDGIHWRERAHRVIPNRIDCLHTMVYDEERDVFVSFLRNKLIFGGRIAPPELRGNTRAISRLSNPDWWTTWDGIPASVLIPDQGDAKRFYGMPTFRYGGVYWGMLQQFDEDPQTIEVELVFSRNGIDWKHLPGRPRLIPVGEPGTWDGGMVISGDRVIEQGDEWRIYYTGYVGHHNAEKNCGSIGFSTIRKEGFASIRSGENEGFVLTRPLRWPGGRLFVNADASRGMIRARVTDLRRQTIDGFDYPDCEPFQGDGVRHPVSWKGGSLVDFQGRIIRLEFRLRNADLYAFVAGDKG